MMRVSFQNKTGKTKHQDSPLNYPTMDAEYQKPIRNFPSDQIYDELYIGVDPGLAHLGISLFNKTKGYWDIRQVAMSIWDECEHKLAMNHYEIVFRAKCRTVLKELFQQPIKTIAVEHQYAYFKSQSPEVNYFSKVLYQVLSEYCDDIIWICPKRWRKATNTEEGSYADRKGISWKSPLFADIDRMHASFTVKKVTYEDGMEAALMAYAVAFYRDFVKLNPKTEPYLRLRPTKPSLLNKRPSKPEMISYVTKCTFQNDFVPPEIKSKTKKKRKTIDETENSCEEDDSYGSEDNENDLEEFSDENEDDDGIDLTVRSIGSSSSGSWIDPYKSDIETVPCDPCSTAGYGTFDSDNDESEGEDSNINNSMCASSSKQIRKGGNLKQHGKSRKGKGRA